MKYQETMDKFLLIACEFPHFVTTLDKLFEHPGNTEDVLEQYGLGRKELKRLEKLGHAVRARTKNVWQTGETAPTGEVVGKGYSLRGKGSRTRWILVK